MTEACESRLYFRFYHPDDITIERGRIVYDTSYRAWVLPGGFHTLNRDKAESAARWINEVTKRQEENHEDMQRPV